MKTSTISKVESAFIYDENDNQRADKVIDLYDEIYNPELTIKQLEHMHYLPIFIVILKDKEVEYKSGWKINNHIIERHLYVLNMFSSFEEKFRIEDYGDTWIAFRYENKRYIDKANPAVSIQDINFDDFYYFKCKDDDKSGWKEVRDIGGEKIRVTNRLNEIEYYFFHDKGNTWDLYKEYRE